MSGYAFTVNKTVRRAKAALVSGAKQGERAVSLGFRCQGGVLAAGTDVVPLGTDGLAQPAEGVFSAGGCLLAYAGGNVYVRAAEAQGWSLTSIALARLPAGVRVYDDAAGEALLLSDGAQSLLLTADGVAQAGVPAFTAGVYAYDRLWLATGECGGVRLRYSSFENWRDFAENVGGGGYVDVPDGMGGIAALVLFENEIFVFRSFGWQRLVARGDDRAFELRDGYPCAGVYGDTVAVCGDKIVWLAEDGLHACDGSGDEPFCVGFSGRLCGMEQPSARACAANGRYYLQAQARLGGRTQALFSIAESGEEGCALTGAFGGLTACEGRAYVVYNNAPCTLSEGAKKGGLCAKRVWEGELYPPAGAALLERVSVDADAGFTVRAFCQRGARAGRTRRSGMQSVPVALFGAKFRIRIEGGGACGQVRGLTAVWAYEEAAYDDR